MKKRLKVMISAIFVSVGIGMSCKADAIEKSDDLTYTICPEGAVITGIKGEPGDVFIPERLDGHTVVGIRENAFYKCEGLKSINIPKTVTSIGHHAFYGCELLVSVDIAGSISKIEEGCFSGCTELKNIRIGEGVSMLGKYCFYSCKSLERIAIPGTVKEIGKYAFSGCSALESMKLPDGLVSVEDFAFYDCPKLRSVDIPESIGNIGTCAFGYSGKSPFPDSSFIVSGSAGSLGKIYADENSFIYNTDQESENERASVPILPATLAIGAAAGLMVHKMVEKTGELKFRYEYEK